MIITKNSDTEQLAHHTFRISDIDVDPSFMPSSISGYEKLPIVPLQVAVEPLIPILPAVDSYAYAAKQRCKDPSADGLTIDESAAIMLYSMAWKPLNKCLSVALNAALRADDYEELEPWYLYLKLFLTALSRLPSVKQSIYRGIQLDLSEHYRRAGAYRWWGFSSCTNIMNILQSEQISNTSEVRTLFSIKCKSGKDISKHCYFPSKNEIIILPNTTFNITGCVQQGNDLHIVHAEEEDPSPILEKLHSDVKLKSDAEQDEQSNAINQNTTTTDINTSNQESESTSEINIQPKKRWIQTGVTVAGGNNFGCRLDQIGYPLWMYLDEDNEIIGINDSMNYRIVEWKFGATSGRVVAGGMGGGQYLEQLHHPLSVIVDKKTNHLLIADYFNNRIVRWSRENGKTGELYMEADRCMGLTMDNYGYLYVSHNNSNCVKRWKITDVNGLTRDNTGYMYFFDTNRHEVRPWKMHSNYGTIVAGGNGKGNRVSQLDIPRSIFVDQDRSVYVSDQNNHRVMKWIEGASEGIVVAGSHGKGNSLKQLCYPQGVVVDQSGDIYIADRDNHRIVCWPKDAKQGYVVVGGNGEGNEANQLNSPRTVLFDREGNLFVADTFNHRIQKFNIEQSLEI